MRAPARLALSAAALAGAALASPAAAHGSCDVIPWNPIHQLDNSISGTGEAQCFPETHSSWDVTTCLDYRQVPVGDYETVVCERAVTSQTGNGISVTATTHGEQPRCRTGWWRTRVTAFIGGHSGVQNVSPDVIVVCRSGSTEAVGS